MYLWKSRIFNCLNSSKLSTPMGREEKLVTVPQVIVPGVLYSEEPPAEGTAETAFLKPTLSTLGIRSQRPEYAAHCTGLPSSQHTLWAVSRAHPDSEPRAAVMPACLPWTTALSHQGQPGTGPWMPVVITKLFTIIISSVSLSPHSPYSTRSFMMQCHIQVVTWSLGVTYQSNNRRKQHSGSKVLPRAC